MHETGAREDLLSPVSGTSEEDLSQEGTQADANKSPPAEGDLRILELIGAGGFGNVYRALWQRQIVAVKIMEHGEESLGFDARQSTPQVDMGTYKFNQLYAALMSTLTSASFFKIK